MTQARFDLDPYTIRVLDTLKGKYQLRNREQALRVFIRKYGPNVVKIREIEQKIIEKLNMDEDCTDLLLASQSAMEELWSSPEDDHWDRY